MIGLDTYEIVKEQLESDWDKYKWQIAGVLAFTYIGWPLLMGSLGFRTYTGSKTYFNTGSARRNRRTTIMTWPK